MHFGTLSPHTKKKHGCQQPFPCPPTTVSPPVAWRRYTVRPKPQQLALNCNSSLVAAIDAAGVLTVQDLEAKVSKGILQGETTPGPVSIFALHSLFRQT